MGFFRGSSCSHGLEAHGTLLILGWGQEPKFLTSKALS